MEKKIPMRTCICCRENKPKKELIRIVKNESGISVDFTGKVNGRGAYICNSKECFDKLKKGKFLNRVFKAEIDSTVYHAIGEQLVGTKK